MTSTLRALAITAALSACLVRPAHSQTGRLEGTVTDSVHARPLRGVQVQALGVESPATMRGSATTDSSGRFRIDSLPPGRYMVGFEAPLLDSLEIALPPRAAEVAPGRAANVELALPPARKLRAALCPGVALGDSTGVVYGHVVSAETEGPLSGVDVALQWMELAVWDKAGSDQLRTVRTPRTASVTTDAAGWYRICGVPTGTWMSMQLQHEGRVGAALRTLVDDTLGIAIRHLSFSATGSRDSSEFADSTAPPPLSGTATLAGVIRGPVGEPVAAAEVHVLGARGTAVTDAEGRYTLGGLPAGTQAVEVRRIGYSMADAWVDLRAGATATGDVRLQRVVSLDSVRIVATATRYKEFYQHQKMGLGGRYLGPEQIQRMRVSRTSDIIRSMPGFVVENRGGRSRVYAANTGRMCVVNVAIDGFSGWRDDVDAFSVDDVPPNQVGAIEMHAGYGSSATPELDRGCGVIVIWTKRPGKG